MAKLAEESKSLNLAIALEDILTQNARCGKTHVIAIDGAAGSGKTTLACELSLALSLEHSIVVIHLDDIYEGWDDALGSSLTSKLKNLLVAISQGKSFTLPIFDWSIGAFSSQKVISPSDVLIIEGVGSAQAVVRPWTAATIWLDVAANEGLRRVLDRDGDSIVSEMVRWQLREAEHFYSDQTRENADFILSTS